MENRNVTTYPALAAGSLLLADQVRRYRRRTMLDDLNDHVTDVLDTDVTARMPATTAVLGLAALVGGKTKEWDSEITEQIPDKRIAWRSTNGVANAGVVTFHKIGDNRTRVMLQMDYQPETVGEKVGDAVGGVKLTAKGNLKRFKQLVERRGAETGAWRGTVTEH